MTVRMTPRDGEMTGTAYPGAVQGWSVVGIFVALFIISMLDRNIFSLMAEDIRRDFGLSDMQLGLLFGPAFAISYAVGALPIGYAMDRFSRRWIIWAGVTVWSLGTIVTGMAGSFLQLFGGRAVIGAGEAVLVPGGHSMIADLFPPERRTLPLSVYSIGGVVGLGLSLTIGGFLATIIEPSLPVVLPLVGTLHGWQAIFILVGLPGIAVATLIFLTSEPIRQAVTATGADDSGYRAFLSFAGKQARFFVNFYAASACLAIIMAGQYAWTPVFFQRAHGWPVAEVGLWLGAAMMAGPLIGLPVHGAIVDRLLRRGVRDAPMRYLFWTIIIASPVLAAAYMVGDPRMALVLLGAGHAILCGYLSLLPAAMQSMVPGQFRAKAASLVVFTTGLAGIVLGPTLVSGFGLLLDGPDKIGSGLVLSLCAIAPIAAANCFATLRPLRLSIPPGKVFPS